MSRSSNERRRKEYERRVEEDQLLLNVFDELNLPEQQEIEQGIREEQHEPSQQPGTTEGSRSTGGTRRARSQTTWPTDVVHVGEANDEGVPLGKAVKTRLARVCGLTARQRVGINCAGFSSLTQEEKQTLFNECVQKYVAFPEHLLDKGFKLSMKMISKLWRHYKSILIQCLKKGEDPFKTHKELKQEDWDLFVQLHST